VLVIYGDKDRSSGPPEPLATVIRRGLEKAGDRNLTVKIFPDADHSLAPAESGGAKEAARREGAAPEFVPGYLEAMTNWIAERGA
jgi:hypothetical protein